MNLEDCSRSLSQRSYAEFLDFVLMNLLLDSMVRINEALNLKISDINFADSTITIQGIDQRN